MKYKLLYLLLILLPQFSYGQNILVQTQQQDIVRSKDYLYGRMYNEADYYFKLKQLNKSNQIHEPAPSAETLKKCNDSRLPPVLTQEEYNGGIINWPEFFLMSDSPEVLDINRAMSGEMGFWDGMVVRRSILPLRSRLFEYRSLLSGNERIRYRRFLEGLEAHQFYEERK